MEAINVDQLTHSVLARVNVDLGTKMGGDVVLINSGMFPPLDDEFGWQSKQFERQAVKLT